MVHISGSGKYCLHEAKVLKRLVFEFINTKTFDIWNYLTPKTGYFCDITFIIESPCTDAFYYTIDTLRVSTVWLYAYVIIIIMNILINIVFTSLNRRNIYTTNPQNCFEIY